MCSTDFVSKASSIIQFTFHQLQKEICTHEMDAVTITLALGAVFFILFYAKKCQKAKNFPPGPPCLPFVDSMPFIPMKVWWTAETPLSDYLNDNYGDVAGLHGNFPVIFISDADILKRVFKMEEFSARPQAKPFQKARYGDEDGKSRGLLFSTGTEWKEQRRFTMRSLKDMGFGKTSMEDSINIEVEKLVNLLKKEHQGKPVSLNSVMNLSIVNALWVLLVGETLPLNDPKLLKIVAAVDQFIRQRSMKNSLWARLGTWAVEKYDPIYRQFISVTNEIKDMVIPYIKEHQTQQEETAGESADYISEYLREIKKNSGDASSSFHGTRGEESLVSSMLDLFLAGTETTTSSLMWGILFLLHHPEVQDNVHQELDRVLGDKKMVAYEERTLLPYTCAVINEIHRHASIVRVALPHSMSKDITVEGYTFPKGTIVFGNLIRIHHDKRYWSHPDTFDPERFYDREKSVCTTNVNLMPFSVGKRYCLGQSLAEKEFFMFFVGLLKAFKFTPSKEDGLPDCGYHSGGHRGTIRFPPIYKVVLESR